MPCFSSIELPSGYFHFGWTKFWTHLQVVPIRKPILNWSALELFTRAFILQSINTFLLHNVFIKKLCSASREHEEVFAMGEELLLKFGAQLVSYIKIHTKLFGWKPSLCISRCILHVSASCVWVCVWAGEWGTGYVQRCTLSWWRPTAALLFYRVTWWWVRRAQAGMWSARLILLLPCPERVALFLSVRLSICSYLFLSVLWVSVPAVLYTTSGVH